MLFNRRLLSLNAGLIKTNFRRFNVDASKRTIHVKQGHHLHIHLKDVALSNITIAANWQDHCDIVSNCNYNIHYDEANNLHTVNFDGKEVSASFTVPEYVNLNVASANELHLSLNNKIQGDCHVSSQCGSIAIDKLRGEILDFNCGSSDITVKKSIEGNIGVQCQSFTAKMIHGDSVSIDSSARVIAEAIYSPSCVIESKSGIEVGVMSGSIQAYSSEGHVSVAGIDGRFELLAGIGTIRLQVNKLYPDSKSLAHAEQGHIVASVDPELAASVLCQSNSYHATRAKITIMSDDFVRTEYDEEMTEDKKEGLKKFSSGTMQGGRVTGYLSGNSKGTKRPSMYGYFNTNNSGKINIKYAEEQALDYTAKKLIKTEVEAKAAIVDSNGPKPDEEYDIQLLANGNIRLESLSWIEVIRRKYGFGDDSEGPLPQAPGRTASAGIRAAQARKELNKQNSNTSSDPL